MARAFMAYENETDSFEIDGLTIENRLDRISLYGTVDLTKDKEGYRKIIELKRIIDAAYAALKGKDLPDHIDIKKPETIKNPF